MGWLESWGCLETLTTTPAVWCHSVVEKATSFVITQGTHRGIQKNDEFHHFPVGTIWKNDLPKPMFSSFSRCRVIFPSPFFWGGKTGLPVPPRRHEAMVWRTVQRGRKLRLPCRMLVLKKVGKGRNDPIHGLV